MQDFWGRRLTVGQTVAVLGDRAIRLGRVLRLAGDDTEEGRPVTVQVDGFGEVRVNANRCMVVNQGVAVRNS